MRERLLQQLRRAATLQKELMATRGPHEQSISGSVGFCLKVDEVDAVDARRIAAERGPSVA